MTRKLCAAASFMAACACAQTPVLRTPTTSGAEILVLREPSYPISHKRLDVFQCAGGHNMEVGLSSRPSEPAPGKSSMVATVKINGVAVDASALDAYLSDFNAYSAALDAHCPGNGKDVFYGELSYWKWQGDDATNDDRVFVRFYATQRSLTAELVPNLPTPQGLRRRK